MVFIGICAAPVAAGLTWPVHLAYAYITNNSVSYRSGSRLVERRTLRISSVMNGGPTGVGRSSRDRMHWSPGHLDGAFEPRQVLEQIGVAEGDVFLDAGCGEGRFSIPAASMVGASGKVYAADTSAERIAALEGLTHHSGLDQVEAFVADVIEQIPAPANTVDVCLMANVFHDFAEKGAVRGELSEIKRVLRPEGTLAILDFRKDVDRPPGPPLSRRLNPLETERLVSRYGFRQESSAEVGRYHYLSIFRLVEKPAKPEVGCR